VLPEDIAIQSILEVESNFHARFDATIRFYEYQIHTVKDPFLTKQSFYLQNRSEVDFDLMQDVATLIKKHTSFLPFCKTGSDNKNFQCHIYESDWRFVHNRWNYRISANRFLRGMVRLIVGTCLNAGFGKIKLEEISESLEKQIPLPIQWSVPPEGLFLNGVLYLSNKSGWEAYPQPVRLLP
jgi:tRNA pseudouridine38-40 synthase